MFLGSKSPLSFSLPQLLSRLNIPLICNSQAGFGNTGGGKPLIQGQQPWVILDMVEYVLFSPQFQYKAAGCVIRHPVVLISPICSLFGPCYVCWRAEAKFLFPFGCFLLSLLPFLPSAPAAPHCGIKLSKSGVQTRALGVGEWSMCPTLGCPQRRHCLQLLFWVEFLSVDQSLAPSEISEIFVTNEYYICHSCFGEFLIF